MSDVARKPCPGCRGANLIPVWGTLCSWCQRFPAHVYPAVTSPAAARAEIDRRPLKMLPERSNPFLDGRMAAAIERIGTVKDEVEDEHARHRARFERQRSPR